MVNQVEKTLDFFQNKKVFVTGHTGFKGTWLLALLHQAQAKISGYALQPTHEKGIFNAIKAQQLCEKHHIGDIRNKELLEKAILEFEPDVIFHLAAQPLVRYSYEQPEETFGVNVMGTVNVLEAAKKLAKKCTIIVITTDKVYENKEWIFPYREVDNLGGHDPYSTSKACAELVCDAYRKSFFNTNFYEQHQKVLITARAGNVIGGGDYSKDRLIPDLVKSIQTKEPVVIRNPAAVRPWQWVVEPLWGYLQLAAYAEKNLNAYLTAWNFGPLPTDNLSVGDLVALARQQWKEIAVKFETQINQPHEAHLLRLDVSQAMAYLAWKPTFNAQISIQKTLDWYQMQQQNPENLLAFTWHQINEYVKKITV
jgi:CDP-glucose 4,6-dehydratase